LIASHHFKIIRNYKKKINPKRLHHKTTQEQLDTVLHHLQQKSSIRAPARKARINEATLRYNLKKNKINSFDNVEKIKMTGNAGPCITIPEVEETTLAAVIQPKSKWGFHVQLFRTSLKISLICTEKKRPH